MAGLLPTLWGHPNTAADPAFTSLQREVEKVFDEFQRGLGLPRTMAAGDSGFAPRLDVVETDEAIEVTTELPGVAEADVEVTIVDDVLTIRGEKKAEKKEEQANVRVVERSYGAFQRALRLPFRADNDKVEAHFKDGVLKVVLRKPPEEEAKTHKIAIKSGA